MNRIVLITGLAGAGRTTASDALEDMGFFAMENLPSAMIKNVCEEMRETHSDEMSLAVAVDLRDLESIKTLFEHNFVMKASLYTSSFWTQMRIRLFEGLSKRDVHTLTSHQVP